MVWVLYLSIDHRHGGSEAKLDHHLAVVSCYNRDKTWRIEGGSQKNQESERRTEENDQVGFLGWQTRKKNQEIPQKEAYNEAPKTTELTGIQGQVPISEEYPQRVGAWYSM